MRRSPFALSVLALIAACGGTDSTVAPTCDEASDAGCSPEQPGDPDGGEIGRADEDEEEEPPSEEPASACDACSEGVCDPAVGACVACLANADCASGAPFCVENTCVECAPGDATCDEEPPPTDPTGPTAPGPAEPESPSPFGIRFATYNVRTSNLDNGAWGDSHKGWDANDGERMGRIVDEIVDQKLTVVAAQEMRAKERDAVLAGLKKRGQEWGSTPFKQGKDDTVVLYRKSAWSRVSAVEVEFVLVPLQASLGSRYQVGVLLQHTATKRKVWFYSIHFAAGSDGGAPQARITAAQKMVDSIKKRAVSKGLPFVLAGDFNTVADGPVGKILVDAGFKYTRKVADKKVNDACRTFNRNAGSAGKQDCPGAPAKHIDLVWVPKGGMQVEVHKVTATQRTSRASDHNPVTTILKKL